MEVLGFKAHYARLPRNALTSLLYNIASKGEKDVRLNLQSQENQSYFSFAKWSCKRDGSC
jgi:hypothetical protein